MAGRRQQSWYLVVPVKEAGLAKTRLVAPPRVPHADLARALALDTLSAVTAHPRVRCCVVSSDTVVADWARSAGARVMPDPGDGLNEAVLAGLAEAPDGPAAVVLADLPAATTADLEEALDRCAAVRIGFVPDAAGTGTVLLAGQQAAELEPRFGAGSAGRHAHAGTPVGLGLDRLRQDVDTEVDLARAVSLGVGPFTRAVLDGRVPWGPSA